MSESMVTFQIRRRLELAVNPKDRATPITTWGKGSRGNTMHLNLAVRP